MIHLNFHFLLEYSKSWIVQIALLVYINSVKLIGNPNKYSNKDILNMFIESHKSIIDGYIEKRLVSYTPNNIMYRIHKPEKRIYHNKKILFVGGRNSIKINSEFSERICNNIGIEVICFQYDGYYGSGYSNCLSKESYDRSIEEMYNTFSCDTELYVIGYSLGCFGAYRVNKRKSIFLISPFYSLEKSIRNIIHIDHFDLNKELEKKRTEEVIIHTFLFDLLTPFWHLCDNFKQDHIKIKINLGNHISGLSNCLMNDIKKYIEN